MVTVEKTIEIEAPVDRVYQQWTRFEQFPEFMEGIEEVTQPDPRHLHWVAEVAGRKKEWDSEITERVQPRRIAWRSTTGTPNVGVVDLRAKDREHTLVSLKVNYEPEGPSERLIDTRGLLARRVEGDLKRFRDFVQSSKSNR